MEPKVKKLSSTDHPLLGLNVGKVDPAASLCAGPLVIAHVEEERFSRQKKGYCLFPIESIAYCLSYLENGLDDVESINLGFEFDQFAEAVPAFYRAEAARYKNKPAQALAHDSEVLRFFDGARIKQEIIQNLNEAGLIKNRIPPINSYPHHYCHAIAAHLSGPSEDSLTVVADGRGELDTFTIWDARGTKLTRLFSRQLPHSLGWVYRVFTLFCGFDAYSGEGMLMGMAPYGKPNAELARKVEKLLFWEKDIDGQFTYSIDAEFLYASERDLQMPGLTRRFTEQFGRPNLEKKFLPYYCDVAYAIQDRMEKTVEYLVKPWLQNTGHKYLSLCGGVFLNCKINGHLWKTIDELEDIYIFPMSGDSGIGLGANFTYSVDKISKSRSDYGVKSVFLGSAFSDEEIADSARRFKLRPNFLGEAQYASISKSLQLNGNGSELKEKMAKPPFLAELNKNVQNYMTAHWSKQDDVVEYTSRKLAEGKVVAWFQGRMEAGPRALGGRSILADPRRLESRDAVNLKVKFRDHWRPFCPSVLAEFAGQYFENPTQSPYMINAFGVTELASAQAPAIVHVDKTARPQFLDREINPLFYDLIKAFYDITGVPILLNTSMNIKGEPMCCAPDDAFQFFFATDVDELVIGSYALRKV